MRNVSRSLPFLILLATACSQESLTGSSAGASTQAAVPGQLDSLDMLARPGEEVYARMARTLPSYGGHFLDSEQRVVLTVTDQAAEAAAVREARSVLGVSGEVVTQQVQFTWAQLAAQRALLNDLAFSMPSVQHSGISIIRNRFEIGVTEAGDSASILMLLRRASTNPGAISVRLADNAQLLRQVSCSGPTLDDCRRPVHLGLRVIFQRNDSLRGCTLGLVARLDDGTNGFVTNSHCSSNANQLDGGSYWQRGDNDPHGPAYLVGTEYRDPAPFDQAYDSRCPSGALCRYSDANFVRFTTTGYKFRWFYHPVNIDPAGGYLTLDTNDSLSMSNLANGLPLQGMYVAKLGQTTGYTEGAVDINCLDVRHPEDASRVFLCQTRIVRGGSAFGNQGDSGSAVYTWNGDNVGHMYGLLWAGGRFGVTSDYFGYASAATLIQTELGSLSPYP